MLKNTLFSNWRSPLTLSYLPEHTEQHINCLLQRHASLLWLISSFHLLFFCFSPSDVTRWTLVEERADKKKNSARLWETFVPKLNRVTSVNDDWRLSKTMNRKLPNIIKIAERSHFAKRFLFWPLWTLRLTSRVEIESVWILARAVRWPLILTTS